MAETYTVQANRTEEMPLAVVLRPLSGHGRQIWRATLVFLLVGLLAAGAYYLFQPARRSASLQFQPIFEGAHDDRYPNGLPFSPQDIVTAPVVARVFANNKIESYCAAEKFQSGFTVVENSPDLAFLNLQYQSRLADTRLTAIDRQRLQDEYTSRRATLPSRFQLLYVQPAECFIPEPILNKVLIELLEAWAMDAQQKRGVMNVRTAILSPAIFDQADATSGNALIRADLLRTAVSRVIANIMAVERLPGSELVRGSDKNVSFAEVRAELEDLLQARLGPVVVLAGGAVGRSATLWVEQALQRATIRHRAAEQRAEAYRQALREYSGQTATPTQPPPGPNGQSTDVQALTPQIDSTFIDRIVQLSAANTSFRQEITRDAIAAMVDTVEQSAVVEQYKLLLESLRSANGEPSAEAAINKSLTQLGAEAKVATKRFNDIYSQYSAIAMGNGSALYRIDEPPQSEYIRTFTLRALIIVLVGIVVLVPIVLAITILLRYHVTRLIRGMR